MAHGPNNYHYAGSNWQTNSNGNSYNFATEYNCSFSSETIKDVATNINCNLCTNKSNLEKMIEMTKDPFVNNRYTRRDSIFSKQLTRNLYVRHSY